MARLIVVAVTALAVLGRRRAGMVFGREPTFLPIDEVDDDQLKALVEDPLLAVQIMVGRRAGSEASLALACEPPFEALLPRISELREFHEAHGSAEARDSADEARSEGDASPSGAAEAKGAEGKAAAPVDPMGTAPAAAAGAEESRERTDDVSASAGAASDGERQPGETAYPPVAAEDTPSPKRGRAKDKPADAAD